MGVSCLVNSGFHVDDLAVVWLFQSADHQGPTQHGARALPLPWAGVGFYFL